MHRRSFIKNVSLGASSLMLLPSGLSAMDWDAVALEETTELERLFKTPPDDARPWVFWQWMNGNITKEGITLDLEAMKRMGIGGMLNFNNSVGIVRGPVDYASEVWFAMVAHATAECHRLGLKIMFHNGAGYSGSAGPWITPEMSMQQLVWTEIQFKNLKNIKVAFPQPQAKEGYYKDIALFAYPSLSVENGLMKDKLKSVQLDGKAIDFTVLSDQDVQSKIRMEGSEGNDSILTLEFAEPFESRSITITRRPEEPKDLFDGPRDHPPVFIVEASQDGKIYTEVARFSNPELREMDTPSIQNFKATKAKFFRLKSASPTWLSSLELHSAPRLAGWPGKGNWTHGNVAANAPDYTDAMLIDPEQVIDISKYLSADGQLDWAAPKKGNWTIVRMGHTTTGEVGAAHPDAAKGLEVDKFSKQAVDFHYNKFLSKFINKLQPYKANTFLGFTTDSWEAGRQNWSAVLPSAFKSARNYDIGPWLLVLTGRILQSVDASERFLWDMNKTQAGLLSENYYGHLAQLCHDQGLQYHAEPYGDGNLDSLQAGQYLDVPMSEFWVRYIYGGEITSKMAAAIGNVYGKKVVAAEAYTGMPLTSKWTGHPYAFKAEGDYFFTMGINRLVFHVFVHQPHTTGFPGMTMGLFGTHFDRNNTWSEVAYGWTGYVQRAQYLLQQGLTIADVCYFKGDEPASGINDIYRILPAGYRGDVVGRDALFSRFAIKDKRIVLPDGMSYALCIMADIIALLPETLKQLTKLVDAGMTLIVNTKPQKALGAASDSEVKKLADELYGDLDGKTINIRTYGKGKIIWGNNYNAIFEREGIAPDFTYVTQNQGAAIHYIHKKLDGAEYYFITNHKRRNEKVAVSLRVTGLQPELWNAETVEIVDALVFKQEGSRTIVSLDLAPAASVFIVFRKAMQLALNGISKDGAPLLATAYTKPDAAKYAGVKNTFSITFWAKPETYAHIGRSLALHPAKGAEVFGEGHASIGLGIGQNGIRVYERATKQEVVLDYAHNIEGWTHMALFYKAKAGILYVNGQSVGTINTSKYTVHPGFETPAEAEQYNCLFEGNLSEINLDTKALSASDVKALYSKGLPESNLLLPMFLEGNGKAVFTQNGTYEFKGPIPKYIDITNCSQQLLNDNWAVSFPKTAGAPNIQLDVLQSLRLHENFDVKHFAGTAVYKKDVAIQSKEITRESRFLLSLGRVEVIAKVLVNGKEAGLLWKEPYQTDITKLIKSGANELTIELTTLLPNRLIGDEHLPIENGYSKHGFIEKLPEWYVNNQPKPGERKTFAVWHNYEKTDPLVDSGLLGPVTLIKAVAKTI